MNTIPASEMKIDLNAEIKIGDVTMFRIEGENELLPVEVIGFNLSDNTLKVMSCDLKRVWERVSRPLWLRQVEFLKQF